jgi:hypothetical protein
MSNSCAGKDYLKLELKEGSSPHMTEYMDYKQGRFE